MAFTFAAAGTRAEVAAQLRGYTGGGDVAGELAARLAAQIIDGDTDAPPGAGRQVIYVVKASGHAGGGLAASLHLTVEPLAVPVAGTAAEPARDLSARR